MVTLALVAQQPTADAPPATPQPVEVVSAPPAPDAAPTPAPPIDEPAAADDSLDALAADAAKDVLNREVGVASAKALSLRDTPGVVSVVSRADIAALGARDLVDLLNLVAGFQFGTDVQGVTGVLFRGVWGHEGKVLVLWDGFEINEQMYLTAPIENRFPIRAIDRIEIIRGPGSARYGGYAELAVINIISRGASLKGVDVSGTYGHMQRGFGRALGEFNIGNTITEGFLEGLSFAAGAYGGEAARSDQMYNDGYGTAYRMNWENQSTSPTWMNLQLKWGGLSIAALVDAYRIRQCGCQLSIHRR
jgi:outer membrane receptor for ferrienterochelin and colicin